MDNATKKKLSVKEAQMQGRYETKSYKEAKEEQEKEKALDAATPSAEDIGKSEKVVSELHKPRSTFSERHDMFTDAVAMRFGTEKATSADKAGVAKALEIQKNWGGKAKDTRESKLTGAMGGKTYKEYMESGDLSVFDDIDTEKLSPLDRVLVNNAKLKRATRVASQKDTRFELDVNKRVKELRTIKPEEYVYARQGEDESLFDWQDKVEVEALARAYNADNLDVIDGGEHSEEVYSILDGAYVSKAEKMEAEAKRQNDWAEKSVLPDKDGFDYVTDEDYGLIMHLYYPERVLHDVQTGQFDTYFTDDEINVIANATDEQKEQIAYMWRKKYAEDTYDNEQEKARVIRQYLKGIKKEALQKYADKRAKKTEEFTKEAPVLANAGKVVSGLADKAIGVKYAIADAVETGKKGAFQRPFDVNSVRFDITRDNQTVSNTTKKMIDNPMWETVYDIGMSVADNMATAGVSTAVATITANPGLGAKLHQTLMAGGAYQNGVYDATIRGASKTEAMAFGYTSATVEFLTEKIGIDNLLNGTKKAVKEGSKSVLKHIATQSVAEGLEEVIAAVAEPLYDSMIMGEQSRFNLRVNELIENGMEQEEAESKATWEIVGEVGLSFVAGAISGGFSSSIYSGIDAVSERGKKSTDNDQKTDTIVENNEENGETDDGENKKTQPYDVNKVEKSFIDAVDENFLEFIENTENNPSDNKSKYSFGEVKRNLADKIKSLTGIDASNFIHFIKANSVRHIIKDHGVNGETDHSMSDKNDIARIGYVLENFDNIELLESKSKEYRDKNQRPAPMVKISKRIDGTFYVVEAVADTNAQSLAVVSAYIEKAPKQQTENVQAFSSNVQNASADSEASKNIVYQNGEDVKDTYSAVKRGTDIVIERLSEGEWTSEKEDIYNKAVNDLTATAERTTTEDARAEVESEITRVQQVRSRKIAENADAYFTASVPNARIITTDDAIIRADAELRAIDRIRPKGFKAESTQLQDWQDKKKAAEKKLKDLKLVKALADEGFHIKMFDVAEDMEGSTAVGDGATIGDNVYLNINGVNAIKKTLGHEFVHVLKNTNAEAYAEFEKVVKEKFRKEFAHEVEADLESRYEKAGGAYENFTDEMKLEEYAADVAGDMLINPEYSQSLIDAIRSSNEAVEVKRGKLYAVAEAVRNVIMKLRSAVQKLRGTYEYGEATRYISDLQAVHQALAKAYREMGNKKAAPEADSVRYSIEYNNDGTPKVVAIEEDIFEGHEDEKPHNVIRNYLKQHIGEYATIIESGQKVYIGKDLPGEYTHSQYTKSLNSERKAVKGQVAQELKEIIEIASNREWRKNTKEKHKSDAKYGWYKYTSTFRVNGEDYEANLIIRNDADGKKYLYDILGIKKVTTSRRDNTPQQQNLAVQESDYIDTVSQGDADVKRDDLPGDVKKSIPAGGIITSADVQAIQAIKGNGVGHKGKSVNEFNSQEIKDTEAFAKKYWTELGTKSPFFRAWFGDWRAFDTSPVENITLKSTAESQRGIVKNVDTGFEISASRIGEDHIRIHMHDNNFSGYIIQNLKEITEKAILLDSVTSEPSGDTKHKNTLMMHSFYVPVKYDGKTIVVKLFVEEFYNDWNKQVQRRNYDLKEIEAFDDADEFGESNSTPSYASKNTSIKTVSDLFNIVKQKDSDFKPNPASVVRNADGTPKVVYHGTGEKFTRFDITKSRSWEGVPDYDLPGFYFAESKEDGLGYGETGEYYIKITKPYEGDTYALAKEKGSFRQAYEHLISEGYDGVIVDEFGEGYNEYIVLKAANIKSVTGNIGTFDKSNPDIRFSMPAENEKTADEAAIDGVVPYTEHEKKNWEGSSTILIYESDEQFNKFVIDALNNQNANKKMYFGKVPTGVAEMVRNKTGVEIDGYNIALKGHEVRKILLYSHGNAEKEASRGQEAITVDDLKKIPLVIANPDNVILSDKLYEGKPLIYFEKLIDGKMFVATYVSRKHHDVSVQTMYKRKRSLAPANDAKSPFFTSETTSGTASSTDTVSQENADVKRDDLSDGVKFSMPTPTSQAQYEDRAYKLYKDMQASIEEKLGNKLSEESTRAVQGLADSIAKGDEAKAKAWREVLRDSVLKNDMVYYGEENVSDDVLSSYFKSIRKNGSKVLVEKEDSQDLTTRELSSIFGVGGWSRTSGIGVDVVYEEIVNMGAQLADVDSVQDRLLAIKDAREKLRNKDRQPMLNRGKVTEMIDEAERDAVNAVSEVERARGELNPTTRDDEGIAPYNTREPVSQENVQSAVARLNKMHDAIKDERDEVTRVGLEDAYREESLKFFEWIMPHFTRADERGVTGDYCFHTNAELDAERGEVAESQRAAVEADRYMEENKMSRDMVMAAHMLDEGETTVEDIGKRYRNVEDRDKIFTLAEMYKKVTASPDKLKKRHRALFEDVVKHLFYYSSQMRDISHINVQADTPERIIDKICRVNQIRDAIKGEHGVTGDKSDGYFILAADNMKEVLVRGKDANEARLKKAAKRYKEIIKKLKIKAGSEDSALIQDYGEGRITKYDIPFDKRDRIVKAAETLTEEVYKPLLEEANRRMFIEGKGEFVAPPLRLTESERRSFQYMLDNVRYVREHIGEVKAQIKAVGAIEAAKRLHLNEGIVQAVSDYGDNFEEYIKWVECRWIKKERLPILQQAWNLVQRGKKYNPRSGKIEMDYFPHFEKDDAIVELGNLFIDQLPTAINGLTESFRPNSKYNPYFNERTGNKTDSDAIFGANAYINATLQYIYHTSDITKVRLAENHLRTKYGKDGGEPYALSNVVLWLHEWGNQMAGKQHAVDRMTQNLIGRRAAKFLRLGMGNVGRNQISWNLRTPFSNFSVWTRGLAVVAQELASGGGSQGLSYAFSGWKEHIQKSDFLYSRFYDDVDLPAKGWRKPITGNGIGQNAINTASNVINTVSNAGKKVSDVGFRMMAFSDKFTITAMHKMLTGIYIAQGMSEEDAIRKADYEMKSQAASRDFGDAPLIFSSQTLKPLTMFQVEALNQIMYGKDVIAKIAKNPKTARYILAAVLGVALEAWFVNLFNWLMKISTGSPVMLDTAGIIYESLSSLANGKGIDEIVPDIMEEIPIVNNAMKAAKGEMSEMVGIGAAVNVANNIIAGINPNDEINWGEMLYNVGLIVNPFGGLAQARKMYQTMNLIEGEGWTKIFLRGDGYSENNKGEVRYAVDGDARDVIMGLLFGKSAMPSVQEWWDSGYDSLSKNNSNAFKQVLDLYDIKPEEAYDMMMDFQQRVSKAKENDESYSSYEWVTEELPKWNAGKWSVYDKYFISCLIDRREASIPKRMEYGEKIIAELYIRTGDSEYLMQNAPEEFSIKKADGKYVYEMDEAQQELYQDKYQEVLVRAIDRRTHGKDIDAIWSDAQWKEIIKTCKDDARNEAAQYCLEQGYYGDYRVEEPEPETDTYESLRNNEELTDEERFELYIEKEKKDHIVYEERYAAGWNVMRETFLVEGDKSVLPTKKERTFSNDKKLYTLNDEQYAKFVEYYNEAFYERLAEMKDYTYEQRLSGMAKLKRGATDDAKARIMEEYEGQLSITDKK